MRKLVPAYAVKAVRTEHYAGRKLEVEGVCFALPAVGDRFMVLSPDTGLTSLLTTTVTTVSRGDGAVWGFTTLNSTYRLEFL